MEVLVLWGPGELLIRGVIDWAHWAREVADEVCVGLPDSLLVNLHHRICWSASGVVPASLDRYQVSGVSNHSGMCTLEVVSD